MYSSSSYRLVYLYKVHKLVFPQCCMCTWHVKYRKWLRFLKAISSINTSASANWSVTWARPFEGDCLALLKISSTQLIIYFCEEYIYVYMGKLKWRNSYKSEMNWFCSRIVCILHCVGMQEQGLTELGGKTLFGHMYLVLWQEDLITKKAPG